MHVKTGLQAMRGKQWPVFHMPPPPVRPSCLFHMGRFDPMEVRLMWLANKDLLKRGQCYLVFVEHLEPGAAGDRLLIFGVSNVCLCGSVVTDGPWLKSSITATLGLLDSLFYKWL